MRAIDLLPIVLTTVVVGLPAPALAQDPAPGIDLDDLLDRLEANEKEQAELRTLVEEERARRQAEAEQHAAETEVILDELEDLRSGGAGAGTSGNSWFDRMTLGSYGEVHFNVEEGEGDDIADIHRFVLYVGYRFADWITFNSETEIEHAFVNDDDGEISIEQLYVDFLVNDHVGIRAGRVLAPLGIINENHEPVLFNGVERPNFDRVIIPSTWNLDGVGLFGQICDSASYRLYLTSSLDGTGFSDTGGIRGGRLKERPSLNELAVSGRVDWNPFADYERDAVRDLRLGASFFHGGINNGDQGSDPGIDGDVTILSADFQHTVGDFDFRGVYAVGDIDGASELNLALTDSMGVDPGIGSEFGGGSAEVGYHPMPDEWKAGKLAESDLVAFVRYEDYDTQRELASTATANGAADRTDLTIGLTFFLTPQLVVKTDYQFLDDEAAGDRPEQFNLGFGFRF